MSMGFSRQEYWSGLPFPSAGDLPNPEIKLRSPALQADALSSEPPGKDGEDVMPSEIKQYCMILLTQAIKKFKLVEAEGRVVGTRG